MVETIAPSSIEAAPAANTVRQRRSLLLVQYQRRERFLLGALTVILLFGVWQLAADQGWVNVLFTSSPTRIWHALVRYFVGNKATGGGSGWIDLEASGKEFLYGFVIAMVIGIPLGILMGWYRRLDALLNPIQLFLVSSPRIAIAPLFVIWFGLGIESKIWVVVLSAIVPIIASARAGVVTIEPALLSMSRSYGSSDLRLLRTVVLPGSVPAVSSGLRLGVGQALLGVVLAEYIASTKGLGFVVFTATSNFQTDLLFVAVIVITGLGMLVTAILTRVERHFDRWRV